MVHKESFDAVAAARFGPGFTRPLYDSYCFSRLPGSLLRLLAPEQLDQTGLPYLPATCFGAVGSENPPGQQIQFDQTYPAADHVIFIWMDGFGLDKLRLDEHSSPGFPHMQRFSEHGSIAALTSQFPSTTVVHSVTMASGLPPGQAGVMEWFYHEPQIGRVIAPFLLNYAGDKGYGNLLQDGYTAADIFPEGTYINALHNAGIAPYVYSSCAFTPSDFSRRMHSAATVVPTHSPATAFAQLAENLGRDRKSWHFLYLDSYDSLEHKLGASSPLALAEAENLFCLINTFITQNIDKFPPATRIVVSADHGQVDQSPPEAVYLNRLWPELTGLLQSGRNGKALTGAGGSGRSLMLNLQSGQQEAALLHLRELLAGKAEVFTHEQLLELGAYGPGPHRSDLRERAGHLVVLAHKSYAVGWLESDRFSVHHKGNHGGMTSAEMEIPLLSLAVDDLPERRGGQLRGTSPR
ncbi:MAG: alkaline phosphatase family protein [Spirochaetes bacterium]|nr:alkaline phosphatase family protein [Spirochaetota bacterium]